MKSSTIRARNKHTVAPLANVFEIMKTRPPPKYMFSLPLTNPHDNPITDTYSIIRFPFSPLSRFLDKKLR